eukprot:TRINITY_DN39553_c0_g2_i1.p1 TRINITY_DN39553_c0_g2~~TRINITY_DN39553_c0_g2_i1.p1  ORF type:complete len:254 (-),score=38.22 TRINITY_DN39553_c0_g2_i1:38-799(-)
MASGLRPPWQRGDEAAQGHLPAQRHGPTDQDAEERLARHQARSMAGAAFKRDVVAIRELLQYKADPNTVDENGRLPLHRASLAGDLEIVTLLLEARASPNTSEQEGGSLPLEMAAWNGHAEISKLLLNASANPNAADGRGCTPLVSAAGEGHLATVQVLVARRADPAQPADLTKTGERLTALQAAQEGGHVRVAKLLREGGLGGERSRGVMPASRSSASLGSTAASTPLPATWLQRLGQLCRKFCLQCAPARK